MLDIKYIRENREKVLLALQNRQMKINIEDILVLDEERRRLLTEGEALKSERNAASKDIGQIKKEGGDISAVKEEMRQLGERIAALDHESKEITAKRDAALLTLPNIPHAGAPVGADESANVEIKSWGEPRTFTFEPKAHWDLGEQLGILDFERAARMTGAGFPMLIGQGAKLQRALIQFMLDYHVEHHGYTEIAPPYLCNGNAMTGTGQLPKMAEDMYHLSEDDLYLIPTAEVPVTNIYREEVIQRELPIYMTAFTPCFRREAGAAGRDTRGLIRLHQFDKVELVKIVEPETSCDEHEKLLQDAEAILQQLGLYFRVIELCTGDLSFAAAKCYDIELWAPGYGDWLEVSSVSNFKDFQARRAGIRFKKKDGKPQYAHTLNGSGVALPRLVVALLENGQQEDGSIELPEVLWPYMRGVKKLEADL